MSNYKVSVILATYNVEKYIDASFQSLRRQTIGFENLEVIFVDDRSTDKSGQIIDGYAAEYPNVKALHLERNSGYCGRPRNEGVAVCTGETIMFLDPDDLYTDTACETLYTAAQGSGCDIVTGYFSLVDPEGNLVEEKANPYGDFAPFTIQNLDENPEVILMRVAFWAKIYKRSFWEKHQFRFDETIPAQDAILGVETLLAAEGIQYVDKPIVLYRVRNKEDKSISYDITPKYCKGVGKAHSLVYKVLEQAGRLSYFPIVLRGTASYFILQLTDSSLAGEQLGDCFAALRFIVEQSETAGLLGDSTYVQTVAHELAAHRDENAEMLVFAVRPLRQYTAELEEGSNWMRGQMDSQQHALEEKDGEIEGLMAEAQAQRARAEEEGARAEEAAAAAQKAAQDWEATNMLLGEANQQLYAARGERDAAFIELEELRVRHTRLQQEYDELRAKIQDSLVCRAVAKLKKWEN